MNFGLEFGKKKGFKSWRERRKANIVDKLLVHSIFEICKKKRNVDIFELMDILFYVFFLLMKA